MLYRQRVLLAVLEAFGGKLDRTDFQKLLFLYSERLTRPSYDFFPHKYGCFSLLSFHDQTQLMGHGYLAEADALELADRQEHISKLHVEDRVRLGSLVSEVGDLRGWELLRKVYLSFPRYAVRSSIAAEILSPQELQIVRSAWHADESPCLATIGYQGMTIDRYLATLLEHNIHTLVDVRYNPVSMKYGFAKNVLRNAVERVGIDYTHIPSLGIPSALRREIDGPHSRQALLERYVSHMLPAEPDGVAELRAILQRSTRTALTCFEANPWMCHRHKLVEYLQMSALLARPVVHLDTVSADRSSTRLGAVQVPLDVGGDDAAQCAHE